jgi:uroporphyrinogen-III synthase
MGPSSERARVIVTRPREQAAHLVARLEALGLGLVCPLIKLESIVRRARRQRLRLGHRHQSARGAQLAERHRASCRAAAIGPGTAAALCEHDIEPALVPRVSTQEGLVAEFPDPGGQVLFAGAEGARPYLAEALGAETLVLYRTRPLRPAELPEGDLVVLASASAARAYAELGLEIPGVSIGPETTRESEAQGVKIVAEAETHDLEGLVAAVARAIRI